jgi:arginase
MTRQLAVLGVPSSAGAHHAGQELAPAALREHGLLDQLRLRGVGVLDAGDLPTVPFALDREHPRSRNLDAVLGVARSVADAVAEILATGQTLLVLGGDCTVTIGVVAGAQRVHPDVGLLYLDGDSDLRGPERTRSGILDNSGVAHLLGLADTGLASLDHPPPMIADDKLVMVGFDDDDAEYDAAVFDEHPSLTHISGRELSSDPEGLASTAVIDLASRSSGLIVHFDVDVVTSGDLPLGNFPHYDSGLDLATAGTVLHVLCAHPSVVAVVLTEVNPSHDASGDQLARYVEVVAAALTDT